jgi:phenylacetate-coenzyme A ligase PaaK-like adenylate-forming protein
VDRYDKMVLQFRDVLAETERLAPGELQSYQNKLLEPLLLHARQHVPFYGQRLAPVFRNGTLDLGRFNEISILTRAQAQANVKALASVDLPPHVGGVARKSGGLSGRRTVLPVTARLLEKLHCVDQRL